MSGVVSYSTLEPTTNDNKWSLLAKILLATLQGGGSGPTAPATFVSNMVGVVLDYAGASAPSGFLLCFGQTVSRATYSALFEKIGTTFGAGDGSTTFGLPDLRGRVSAGQDDMGGSSANRLPTGITGGVADANVLGSTGGEARHSLTHAETPTFALSSGTQVPDAGGSGAYDGSASSNASAAQDAHNTVQPTIILNKIIFTGVA